MNNEQFERRMEFIVEQQAKNTVYIEKLQGAQAELTKKHNQLTDALTTVVSMIGKLAQAQERTDEQLSELVTKQTETDERLSVLIGVVERYFNERGNGRSRKTTRMGLTKGKTRGSRKKRQ